MYGGDEAEATGEDSELERYGLTEELNSGSGDSDTEEALYRQVHYNISNDDNIQNTTKEDRKSYIGRKEGLLPTSRDSPTKNPNPNDKDEIDLNTADIIITSDNDDDDRYDWKRLESDSKYKVSLKTTSQKIKAAVVVEEDSEPDIVFMDVERKAQESRSRETMKKEGVGKPRKRSWRKMADDDHTKITKIDRTGWSSARKGPEAQTGMSETSKVVIIADDSSSSSVIVLDTERSEEEVSRPKQRPREDNGEFFLDNKGMALEDIQKDKDSAELGWKAERKKTKAMLKEGVEIIDLSSGEEDCMVIESCSEEEGMHVHFDEKEDPIPPEANDSGIIKGKRKDRERVAPGRYFVQSRQKHIRCHNCNEMGHLKSECPQPPRIPACILCGTRGHTDRTCPDALCFNCSLPGHQSKSCPVKRHIRYATCTRCQMPGHLRKMCPDMWRQYHLTTEHGPIIKPTNQHRRTKQKDVYCSNCSQKGHRYYDCHSARFDEFTVFTYDKVCLYDKKHIGKMVYPAENKNAEYLKLLKERKDEAPLSMTKGNTASMRKGNYHPRASKRKVPEEEERIGEHIRERKKEVVGETEADSMSTEREQSGKNRIPNAVQTFVRTRLFGGKKGKCWAQQDGAVIPSRRQQQQQQQQQKQQQQQQQQQQWKQQQQHETEVASKDGGGKLTKAQKKAQRKALDAQKKQMAKEMRSLNPENVAQVFAEAKQIKRSAASALNAVKREIRAALKQKKIAEPHPNEVTDNMTKEQRKVLKRKMKNREKNELRTALRERVKTDVEVRKVDRVFKEARKIFRDAKKRKKEVDGKARRAQFVPAERQHPVPKESGYSISQRGFNLDNHLLEGTHHHDNRRMMPLVSSFDEAFPRSNTQYNGPNFAWRSYGNGPAFSEGHYQSNPNFTGQQYSNTLAFTDGPKDSGPNFENISYNENLTLTVTCPNRKKKRRKGKRRKKQGGQLGS